MTFDSITVTGARPNQARYLRYLFEGRRDDAVMTMDMVEDSYYRAVTDGKLTDLLPQARFNSDGNNMLLLKTTVKNPWEIGVGGWISSSTNSMLYIGAGYHTLSFNSLDIDLGAWVGQSYYAAQLSAKFALRTELPSYMQLEGVVSRQKYYDSELLFYQTSTPSFITDVQGYFRARYCRALGHLAKGYASLAYGWERDDYFPDNAGDFANVNKDRSDYKIAVVKAGVEYNTLNDPMYPSSGKQWLADITLAHEDNEFIPGENHSGSIIRKGHFSGSAELLWRHFFPIHRKFKIGGYFNGLFTIQNLYQNYTATMVHAAAFEPTPSTRNYFNVAFRSDNYGAIGIIPIWTPYSRAQLRGDFYAYCPLRHVVADAKGMAVFDGWLRKPQFIGEMSAVYNFPFASLSIYVNYLSSPAHNWNFGINFGLFFRLLNYCVDGHRVLSWLIADKNISGGGHFTIKFSKPGDVQYVESAIMRSPSNSNVRRISLAFTLPAARQAVATASASIADGAIMVALATSVATGLPVTGDRVWPNLLPFSLRKFL